MQRLPGLAEHQTGGSTPGTAHITHYGTEQVSITARARRPAELVLSDTYYPGWKVTVNGRPAQIDPVDYAVKVRQAEADLEATRAQAASADANVRIVDASS